MRSVSIILGLVIALSMFVSTNAAEGSLETITLTSGGLERNYLLYTPANVKTEATLVVMIHGGGGSAEQAVRSYGWNEMADQEGFIVLYPDANGSAWNAGDCCGRAALQEVDDIGFLQEAIADAKSRVSAHITGVAMVGISNGGMLTYRYACEVGGLDAIGVVAATLVTDCANPPPVSVMHVHGLADTRVPIDGSPGDGSEHVDGWPIADVNALWREADNCEAPLNSTTNGIHRSVASCEEGREVVLITLENVDHTWPGSKRSTTDVYETTSELWKFIAEHTE
ncbi:MAG: hypothetical protein KC435_12930 [Thermomicrobiales bacterium]|nr:hypothetical protein [Thermomicrobiales bacterium]